MLRSDSLTGFDPAQWTMTNEHRRPMRLLWVDHKIKLVVAARGVVVNFRRGARLASTCDRLNVHGTLAAGVVRTGGIVV